MVSVIIPVYNGAGTIEKTLRSIAAQSYGDFEVIIVNDGSSDETEQLVSDFAGKDSRFVLISQKNGGVASARNTGLSHASGKYITFIDADDILPEDAFLHMHQVAAVNDADTVVGMYERVDGTEAHINSRSKHLAEKSIRVSADDLDMIHTWSLWNKWFDRGIIAENNIRFEKRRHLEDAVFLYSYLRFAEKIYTCPYIVYRYVKPLPMIGSTTTQRVDIGLMRDAWDALSRICDLTEKNGGEFRKELIYRFLNTPVIGDYYRRIWRFDENGADELTKFSNDLLKQIDPDKAHGLAQRNSDIFTADGQSFLSREEIAGAPLVTVYLSDLLSEAGVKAAVEGLYDQSEVSLRILADKKHKNVLGNIYESFGNFGWTDRKNVIEDIRSLPCSFAAVMETDMVFNHGTLRAMVKALEADSSKDFAAVKYACYDGENVRRSEIISTSFEENVPGIDVLLSNKLFRADSKLLESSLESMNAQVAVTEGSFIRLASPVMLSLSDATETPEKLPTREAGKLYRKCVRKRNIRNARKLAGRAVRKAKRIAARAAGRKTIKAKQGDTGKLSLSAQYYLNLDIDPDMIVIEGLGKWPKGSSLYILRELMKPEYSGYRVVFVTKESTNDVTREILDREHMQNVEIVQAGTGEYKKALFTAAFLINEVDFPNWWTKKPGQTYINIWHGTPLKTLTKKTEGVIHHDATSSRNFTMADYMMFANDYSIEHILMDSDCGRLTNAKGLMLGYPRTSVLFDEQVRKQVRRECEADGKKLYVWMPTWNDAATNESINTFLRSVDDGLTEDELMYVNLHHKSNVTVDYSGLMHISPFPLKYDTYEVLAAADVLITDYSSVFFDFAASRKKIVLHCPDIASYTASRGFNMDIRDLPFPITETEEDLIFELHRGKEYDDEGFTETFTRYDSARNTELLCRSMILGDFSEVEIRDFEKERKAVFIVADSFRKGRGTELLYELADSGKWGDNVYLSFQEKVADENVENVYPLIKNVNIFATKGKPLTERTERNRLYNTIDIQKFILLDPADAGRIRAFSCFPEPVCMILTERQSGLINEGDKDMLKAVRTFEKYENGIYTLSEEVRSSLEKQEIYTDLISDADGLYELTK